MALIVDGVEIIDGVTLNGVAMTEVFIDGVKVWPDTPADSWDFGIYVSSTGVLAAGYEKNLSPSDLNPKTLNYDGIEYEVQLIEAENVIEDSQDFYPFRIILASTDGNNSPFPLNRIYYYWPNTNLSVQLDKYTDPVDPTNDYLFYVEDEDIYVTFDGAIDTQFEPCVISINPPNV